MKNIYLALWWTLNLCCRNHKITLHYWEHLPSAMETIYCTLHCGEHLPYTVKNICPALCEHLICWVSNFSHFSVIFLPAWACSGLTWPILPFQQCCRAVTNCFGSGSDFQKVSAPAPETAPTWALRVPVSTAFKWKSRFFMTFRKAYRLNSLFWSYSICIMI